MKPFEISAELREVKGKGASRRLRRAGMVPGVLYGAGKDPVNLQLKHNDLFLHTEHEAFYSHILKLNVGGSAEQVVLKDMQRHPYKPAIVHIDFQRIDENQELTMRVPLHFMNEEKCKGVKDEGGIISHLMTELEITCLPKNLPEYIEIDVLELAVGDSIHLSDITVPEGVEITALAHGGDPAQSVVSVQMPRVEVIPDEAPDAEAVDEAAEGEAEEAAPDEGAADGDGGDDSGDAES